MLVKVRPIDRALYEPACAHRGDDVNYALDYQKHPTGAPRCATCGESWRIITERKEPVTR